MGECPYCHKQIYPDCPNVIIKELSFRKDMKGGDIRRLLVSKYGYTDSAIFKSLHLLLKDKIIEREKFTGRQFKYRLKKDEHKDISQRTG